MANTLLPRAFRKAARVILGRYPPASTEFLRSSGHCPICDQDSIFVSRDEWLRDHFLCTRCGSLPRERALMACIQDYLPDWRSLVIHESSPAERGASERVAKECTRYIASQYFPDRQPGSRTGRYICENLEALSFPDESIDLHITQDVIEHVFDPEKVFQEIARTLRPGGAHIFTVPIVNKRSPTKVRARRTPEGEVEHLEPPVFHGNPISDEGSLVTMDWGYDICEYIHSACGLYTQMIRIDDLSRGIRAEYIEVLITFKA